MQLLLYTTLHVKGQATAYKIYFHQYEKKYFFKPDRLSLNHPSFHIWRFRGHWFFDGLDDNEVKEQAIEDIQNIQELKSKPLL